MPDSNLLRHLRTRSLAAILLSLPILASAQPAHRTLRIDESQSITLPGNTHPQARPEFDRGPIAPETQLNRLVLVLNASASRQSQLDTLVESQQQPGSPDFHHWLTPQQYGARFGASSDQIAHVTAWLQAHGFSVEPIPPGRRLILFSGTAAQVEDTFHTPIHRYLVDGVEHIANTQDPQIPQALAPVIAGILSLHDFRRQSAIHSMRKIDPDYSQGSTHYLFPADFATIYDLSPLYAAGNTGTGASIAIVGRSNINLSDVAGFRSYAGLSVNAPTVTLDGPNPGLIPGDQDEATLDVEWSGAVAPSAAIRFVAAASTSTTDGVDLSAQYIVNNKTAPVMSTSFGNCEANMGSAEMAFYNSLWQQAASEGITAFVSSGDSGAAGCNGGSSTAGSAAGVNGLCSSPYSTCVGGTEFNEGSGSYWAATNSSSNESALSYIPETVWNESASNGGSGLWSSGGGISQYYTQPTWQKGVSGANSNGMRAVPDVALTSAGHDGYIVCLNGSYYIFSGTSASSPSFAGILSLIVARNAGTAQGSANPTLYSLITASANPFHATPSGSNSVPGVPGFTASGATYNLATGLGSVDANLLAAAWSAGSVTPSPSFTLTPSVASESLLPGKSATFTVAVAGTSGFTGSVALTATTPTGVTLTFNPATVKAGASSTATLIVSASAAQTPGTITITGTSGATVKTASVPLTILASPTLSVTASAESVSLTRGQSTALTVTTATGANFTGAVTLSVSGLPAGVTAAWSKSSFTPGSGASSTTVTLTLTAATTAALNTGTLHITASGDGLTTQTTAAVQVVAAPAFLSINAGVSSVNIPQGKGIALTVTISTKATFSSAVTMGISGLPAGVTARWGANPIAPSPSTGIASVSLILSATTSAPVASNPIVLSATGDGVTATQSVALQVITGAPIHQHPTH